MKNFIGGLFTQQQDADRARIALREAGFPREEINMFQRKPQSAPVHKDRVQAPAVGKAALLGAGILGILGGLFGLLAGLNVVPIPGVDASTYRISLGFVLTAVLAGFLAGGITGAILGAAFRLLASSDRATITSKGIKRGGLLVVTRIDQMNTEETARRILEQYGAIDLQNLTERWDPEVWSELDKVG